MGRCILQESPKGSALARARVKHGTPCRPERYPRSSAQDLHDDDVISACRPAPLARPCQAGDPPPPAAALALATPGLADGQGCSAALRFNLSP